MKLNSIFNLSLENSSPSLFKMNKITTFLTLMLALNLLMIDNVSAGFSIAEIFKPKGAYINAPGFSPLLIPTNVFGKEEIQKYATCGEVWNDMLYWMVLMYGDWYGNHGANTVMYSFWQYVWQRAPQWFQLCFVP